MKKKLIVLSIIILTLCIFKTNDIIIPKESIRFRIIANSNSKYDQKLKKEIVKKLNNKLNSLVEENDDINSVRSKINKEIPSIQKEIEEEFKLKKYNKKISINYGNNYFPQKEYKGIKYNEGKYESLVITIGSGEGNNFWCVLFPPLCNINENVDNIEYSSLVKEIINKYKTR